MTIWVASTAPFAAWMVLFALRALKYKKILQWADAREAFFPEILKAAQVGLYAPDRSGDISRGPNGMWMTQGTLMNFDLANATIDMLMTTEKARRTASEEFRKALAALEEWERENPVPTLKWGWF